MIEISKANGLSFKKYEPFELSNFDNTLTCNEKLNNGVIYKYAQPMMYDTMVSIQARFDLGETATLVAVKEDLSQMAIPITYSKNYSEFRFYEWTIDFIHFTGFVYFKLTYQDEVYFSEKVEVVEKESDRVFLLFEWKNYVNSWGVDYSSGIVHRMYLEADLLRYFPSGKRELYENNREKVLLKALLQRGLRLVTEGVPGYMSEKLSVAMSHKAFYINGIQFSTDDFPEISPLEGSNLNTVNAELIQKVVIGLSSHDTGFDCEQIITDDTMKIQQLNGVSGQQQLAMFDEHLLHVITVVWKAGANPIVIVGSAPGASDIAPEISVTSIDDIEVASIHGEYSGNIYFNITGASAVVDIIAQSFRNREIVI